jgi:hypothetical protein
MKLSPMAEEQPPQEDFHQWTELDIGMRLLGRGLPVLLLPSMNADPAQEPCSPAPNIEGKQWRLAAFVLLSQW